MPEWVRLPMTTRAYASNLYIGSSGPTSFLLNENSVMKHMGAITYDILSTGGPGGSKHTVELENYSGHLVASGASTAEKLQDASSRRHPRVHRLIGSRTP